MRGSSIYRSPLGGHIVILSELFRDEVPLAVVAVEVPLSK